MMRKRVRMMRKRVRMMRKRNRVRMMRKMVRTRTTTRTQPRVVGIFSMKED